MSRTYDYDDYKKCKCDSCLRKYEKHRCRICEDYRKHRRCSENKHSCIDDDRRSSCSSSSDREHKRCEPEPLKSEQPKPEPPKPEQPNCEVYKTDKCGKYVVITINSFDSRQDFDCYPK